MRSRLTKFTATSSKVVFGFLDIKHLSYIFGPSSLVACSLELNLTQLYLKFQWENTGSPSYGKPWDWSFIYRNHDCPILTVGHNHVPYMKYQPPLLKKTADRPCSLTPEWNCATWCSTNAFCIFGRLWQRSAVALKSLMVGIKLMNGARVESEGHKKVRTTQEKSEYHVHCINCNPIV